MTTTDAAGAIPIVCDMTGAPDTLAERMAEYARLFASALVGRERTPNGIRFRFTADPGIEEWVRDIARREQTCCAFFSFTIERAADAVVWDATVVDDAAARAVLEGFYALPDTLAAVADDADGAARP